MKGMCSSRVKVVMQMSIDYCAIPILNIIQTMYKEPYLVATEVIPIIHNSRSTPRMDFHYPNANPPYSKATQHTYH